MSESTYTLEAFEKELHDCLLHLYDYGYLQNHSLLGYLAPHNSGVDRVQIFRQRITAAIEQLRPDTGVLPQSRAGRAYHILTLRYREQQPPLAVATYLSLSERQFYRESNRALQSLAALLWETVKGESPETTGS